MLTNYKRISWEYCALELAKVVAQRSEDPHFQVGACVLTDDSLPLLGYNGCPPGQTTDFSDRDKRRKFMVHAEFNALRFAKPGNNKLIAVTDMPCPKCIVHIAAYKIPRVYYTGIREEPETIEIAKEYGITLFKLDKNNEFIEIV